MKNKNMIYVLGISAVVLIIIGLIIFWLILNKNKGKYSGIYEHEDRYVVTKSYTLENIEYIKKYLFRLWNLDLTENTKGIESICKNYTKHIPKSINSFNIDELYFTNGLSTCFAKVSLNNESYYYTFIIKTEGFAIIEINNEQYNSYIEGYDGNYDNYEIKPNLYNLTRIDDDVEASFYLNIFKNNVENNIDIACKQVKEEYTTKRFKNIEKLKEYMIKNKERLLEAKVNNSKIEKDANGNKKFTFYDKYSNPYIIEISRNEFWVQLDDYTLENKTFNETYKKASIQERVRLNCEKFFTMINTEDYEAAYNLLDQNFKQLNYKTEKDFESFMKKRAYKYFKPKYQEYKKPIDSIYIYKLLLEDASGKNKRLIPFNIIMTLKEGNKFIMSFEIDKVDRHSVY